MTNVFTYLHSFLKMMSDNCVYVRHVQLVGGLFRFNRWRGTCCEPDEYSLQVGGEFFTGR